MFRIVNVHPRTYDPGTSRIGKGTIVERLYKTQSVRFRSSSSHVESSRSPFMQKKTRDSMIEDERLVPLTRAFTHERTASSFGASPVGNQEGSWKRLWPFREHTRSEQCATNLWYTSKRVHTLDRPYKPNSTCKRTPALTLHPKYISIYLS